MKHEIKIHEITESNPVTGRRKIFRAICKCGKFKGEARVYRASAAGDGATHCYEAVRA